MPVANAVGHHPAGPIKEPKSFASGVIARARATSSRYSASANCSKDVIRDDFTSPSGVSSAVDDLTLL